MAVFRHLMAGVVVLLCGSLCAGQQAISADAQLKRQRADALLSNVSNQIKALDEPAIRVFLRLRAAKFLWAEKTQASSKAAETMASEALADIQEHEDAIPGVYVKLFRKEVLAALQLHAPALASQLAERYKLESAAQGFETAYELLGSKDGVARATEMMSRNIQSGTERSDANLNFFLSRLDEAHPAETNRLLTDFINVAERMPGNYPVPFLFGLANKYLHRGATPADLKARFMALFIRASANPAALSQTEQTIAYNLLRANMQSIESLLPSLHAQASAQVSALASALPQQTFAREDADNNIRGSADQLAQTIAEADAAKDEDLRRELLGRAARGALSEGQLTSAVDLIMRMKPRDEKDNEEFISYRDQFLGDVVRSGIARKDYDALAYAAARIRDPLQRAAAVRRLALHFFEARDTVRAREVLGDALKLVESASDDAPKAAALLNLAVSYLKIDDMRVFPTTQASLKIIDSLPGLMPGAKPGSEAHQKYVQTLLQLAYNLVPVFHLLAQKDEHGTFYVANRLHLPELKASAILGASTGVPGVWGTAKASVRPK
jgi:hypothetical protein